jgi:hypothetical protein
LQHCTASLVAAGTGDATTVLGQFALGVSTAQIALNNGCSIPDATAIAHAALQHLAKILQGTASDLFIAPTNNLEPTRALFKL